MKVLVAVDSSSASQKAVQFAAKLAGGSASGAAEVTLFHVVESLPDFVTQKSSSAGHFRAVVDEWSLANQAAGEKLLDNSKQALVSAGVAANKIHTKCANREALPEAARVVAALAIIEEMKSGNYDTVVFGRRGTSAQIESFLGGVAEKVTREANGRTVCVVDG